MTMQDFSLDIRKSKRPIRHIEVVYNDAKILPEQYDPGQWQYVLNSVYNNPQVYRVVFADEVLPTDPGATEEAVNRTAVFTTKDLMRKNLRELAGIAEAKGIAIPDEATKSDIVTLITTNQSV